MSRLENFKYSRWINRGHSLFQFFLVISFFVGLNMLSLIHFKRFDITEGRQYALSPETISYIGELDEPIRIIVTLSGNENDSEMGASYTDVRNLIKEYKYTAQLTGAGPIEAEYVNVYQQQRLAQELVEEFGISQPNLIIFATEQKHRTIVIDELYESEKMEKTAFRGEQMFTSAILDVSSPKNTTIYFLKGHGERDPNNVDPIAGLSQLTQQLDQRNFDIKSLDLTIPDANIPDDADLIVLAGPRQPLMAREVNMLEDYLNNNAGRLIVLIDPAINNNLGGFVLPMGSPRRRHAYAGYRRRLHDEWRRSTHTSFRSGTSHH